MQKTNSVACGILSASAELKFNSTWDTHIAELKSLFDTLYKGHKNSHTRGGRASPPAAGERAASSERRAARSRRGSGADTERLIVGLGEMMFASYPRSIEDPSPLLLIGKPLWLGVRHRYFQWVVDGSARVGFGTSSKSGHLAAGPQIGAQLYLGSWFGLELRVGPVGLAQVGRHTVVGLGIGATGGYVFRFWQDDRRRLKLVMMMQAGGYFARDPGNDLGANASALGGGLVFETP